MSRSAFAVNFYSKHSGSILYYFEYVRKDLMEKVENRKRITGLELKLLFTLWILSKQETFLSAGDRFHIAKSSAHKAFCEILDVLCAFTGDYIKWPSPSQYNSISQAFREKSGGRIPGIIGAIDGCHIQIKQPLRNPIDYDNRKNTHSVILQAVCDHRAVFTDVCVGAPGRLHNARVFRNSPLSSEIDRLVPDEYHLVGDTAYPLKKTL
ncbi:putative nuclease HARBI1 [Episyrphus balteatus]|uniref:putative nuclease HARBI1 n=1 Tax=Episyrphus balteatus TaxID=286459 RepID=UPI0024853CDD|nr:putative nuclease HARBI1 [Episyrphus balteatus]